MTFRFLIALPLFIASLTSTEPEHKFAGKHFFASYLDCDKEALGNIDEMIAAMDRAVASSGAEILNKTHHRFPPDGLTIVYLLSESHASLHTYPEFGACFVDLFTCGDHCTPEGFDQTLRAYLHPKEISARVFLRSETVEEVYYIGDSISNDPRETLSKLTPSM